MTDLRPNGEAAADGGLIAVRGNATDDELAAVLAALADRPSTVDNPYERWRRARVAAIRRTDVGQAPIR